MNKKEYDKKIGEVAEMIITNFEPVLLNNSFHGLKHLVDHYCKDYDVDMSRFTCKEIMYQILKTYEKPDVKKSMINRAKTKFT